MIRLGIKIFLNNIRYLFRYNLKTLYNENNHKLEYEDIVGVLCNALYLNKKNLVPRIANIDDTIDLLINTNKSIARLGDGEFFLINGIGNDFQEYNDRLAKKLKDILHNKNDNLLVGINYLYYNMEYENYTDVVQQYFLSHIWKLREQINKNIDEDKDYVAAEFTQLYQIYKNYNFENYFNKIKKIWDNKDIVIGCGETVFDKIEYNIFSNAKNIIFEYMPSKNAFSMYDKLLEKMQKYDKSRLIILILGQTATVLASDLTDIGYRVLDLGHIAKDYDYFMKKIERNFSNGAKFFSAD